MINNQNGKSSVLSFREVKYKNGFDDRDFRKIVLKDLDKLYEVFVNNSCPLSIE